MKIVILALSFLVSFSALAIPYRCVSIEKDDKGAPIVNLKINPKRDYVGSNGIVWQHYYLGISPAKNFPFSRFTAYGQGTAEDQRISLTLVDREFIIGTLSARAVRGSNYMSGELKLGKIQARPLAVECRKE